MSIQEKTKMKINTYLSRKYHVVFLDDNKTTFQFVEKSLVLIFGRSIIEAKRLAKELDKNGSVVAGSGYLKDVAETKKAEVLKMAKEEGYPFQVVVEEE